MKTTPGIYRLTLQSKVVLVLTSVIALAGFVWPFFYAGNDLPRTQLFFWIAIAAAIVLVILEISSAGLDAKSVAQLFAENRKTLLGTVQMAQKEMPYR